MNDLYPFLFGISLFLAWLCLFYLYRKHIENHYLYFIPIEKEGLFKIGITNDIKRRIGEHKANYQFDPSKVLYVRETRKEVQFLENYFLNQLPQVNHKKIAGSTELRPIEFLGYVVKSLDDYGVSKFE